MAAMSTIAKLWKKPRCRSTDKWIKKRWYVYMQWNITQPSKMKSYHCNDVDGSGGYDAKLNKLIREKQLYDFTYMWKLRNKTEDHRERKRKSDEIREGDKP